MITQKELKSKLQYNPDTGVFTWVKRNVVAGSLNNTGYIHIKINQKAYLAHRLAWLYIYGEWPNIIDHISGNKIDNKINNLRNVTHRQNLQNSNNHRNGKLVGVKKQNNKFQARITINKKQIYLGTYDTAPEAYEKYLNFLLHYNKKSGI